MIEICKKVECTGCGVCYDVCPQGCITMKENEIGHLYPMIDAKFCINCGLCRKKCPNNLELRENRVTTSYAAWAINNEIHKRSTSGGVATALGKGFIGDGGIVYGSAYIDGRIKHIEVASVNEINSLQGTKYVESPIYNIIKQLVSRIKEGNKVLFFGTPCQCAAIRSVLFQHENLFLVEVICSGVPSQKMLWEHLSPFGNVDSISFRNKTIAELTVSKNNQIIYSNPVWKDSFLMGFTKHLFLRDSCYKCKYAFESRVADLTIADYWGIGDSVDFNKEKQNGISLVLVNNSKGLQLVDRYRDLICFIERPIEEGINGNPRYSNPPSPHCNKDKFTELYPKVGFEKSIKICLKKERFRYNIFALYKNLFE